MPWIIFLKAISHPYILMNLMPWMIYVHIFILLSLFTLTLSMIELLYLVIQFWRGSRITIIAMMRIPGHPNLVIKMANTPARTKGPINAIKNINPLVSITLKSFDSMLMTFPIS